MDEHIKIRKADLYKVLYELTEYCVSGRRYDVQNPYTVPEIVNALVVIAEVKGAENWITALRE